MSSLSVDSHSKPGSFAGFIFQLERALAWLADGSLPLDAMVGIETDDDVAVRVPGGIDVREQDKHAVKRPPFTNGSKQLWQPLLNWLAAAADGTLDLRKTRLFLVTNQQLPDACLALLFRPSASPDSSEVTHCLQQIRAYVGELKAKPQVNQKACLNLMDNFLAYNETTLRNLVHAVECLDARHGSASASLRQNIFNRLQMLSDDPREAILDELTGWSQRQVQELIRAGKPAWITRDSFVRQYRAIQERQRRQRRRERSEALIPVADGEKDAARSLTFVQQLELIDADDEQQLDAIADFIRCNIERSRLTTQGDITPSDWESFDTNIHKFWKNNQRRVLKFANPDTEAVETKLGHDIYTDCLNYRETLAGEPTQEYYLTRGTLHRQSDAEQLGWHPRYQELLRKPR